MLTLGLGLLLAVREVAERRRRRASRVICWIDHDKGAVHVRNSGDEPVTKVMLALFSAPDHYAYPLAEMGDQSPWVFSWDWLAPGAEKEESPAPVEWNADLFPAEVRMEFTDASDRRWLRDERGRLSRKHVIPFRQDWRMIPRWKKDERQTRRARRVYTRWRWPNI